MAVTRDLEWNGEAIADEIERDVKDAMNDTLDDAVAYAKANHEWKNRTGRAEASIQMRPAKKIGNTIRGQFGSYGVNYFKFLELGTSKMKAMPCLRPAEDAIFPTFRQRLALERGAIPAPSGRGSKWRSVVTGQFVRPPL